MFLRVASDEAWVLDLCDAILGELSLRQHRFDWLRGDPSPKTRRRMRLPVDAYYPESGIVVEYRERQHFEPVAHFDKPGPFTATGMPRGELCARYDALRERLIPEHGLQLLIVTPHDLDAKRSGRLHRSADGDLVTLVDMLCPILQASKLRRNLPEELVRREVIARLVINQALGVVVAAHDDGSLHGMVDGAFLYPDGRRAVVEVTRVIDGTLAAQRKEIAPLEVIPGLSQSWYVRIGRGTLVKTVRSVIPDVLRRLESDAIEELNLEERLTDHDSGDALALREAGVRLISRWHGADPGTVMYAQSGRVGVGASSNALGLFLTDVVNDPMRADNVRKFREHGRADERHLFIWLEFDQAIRWILAFELGIPDDAPGPDIPKGITHIWLAASVSDVVMWSRATGWQRAASLRQTSLTAQGEH